MLLLDLVDDGVKLAFLRAKDDVRVVRADHVLSRRDHEDVEAVDLVELLAFRPGGAGHSGQLLVQPEIVLEGDRRVRYAFALDLHAFLGLDRLVETVRPAASVHQPAGELIDNDDLAVLDDVLLIEVIEGVCLEGGVDEAREAEVFGVVQVLDANRFLNLRRAFVS